jgi:hypothetical protein
MSNNKIEKIINYIKDSKEKIVIKRMRIKLKKKTNERIYNFGLKG